MSETQITKSGEWLKSEMDFMKLYELFGDGLVLPLENALLANLDSQQPFLASQTDRGMAYLMGGDLVSARSFIKAALKAARHSAKIITSTAVCCLGTGTPICRLSNDKMSPSDGLMFAGEHSLQKEYDILLDFGRQVPIDFPLFFKIIRCHSRNEILRQQDERLLHSDHNRCGDAMGEQLHQPASQFPRDKLDHHQRAPRRRDPNQDKP